jgi:heat shock protein HslJ
MRRSSVVALTLGALVALAACTTGGSPSSAPSAAGEPSDVSFEDLEGLSFVVTAAEGYEVVPGSTITLTFEEGRIGIQAGCNTMGSQYRVEDGVLVIGQMITTEMACDEPLMAQDRFLGEFLYNTTIALDGDTLTLSKDGVSLTLTDREVADPDRSLEGTTWLVDSLVSLQAVSSMPAGVEASLVFADGQVQVASGCNTGSGSAEIGDATITFGPIATTRMACEQPAMDAEAQILAVLQGEVGYAIEADRLTLTGDDAGLILRAQE